MASFAFHITGTAGNECVVMGLSVLKDPHCRFVFVLLACIVLFGG